MALINCPECNKEISDKVKTCPQCGYPLIDDTPQKVEVTGVKFGGDSKKKIIISIVTIAVLAFITIGIIAGVNSKRTNDYNDKLSATVYLIYTNASRCESICGNVSETWKNAIYNDYDYYNKGYLDFNKALANLFADSRIKSDVETIKKTDLTIADSVKSLQNPPAKYKDAYNDILELYGVYQGLVSQATNPTGTLISYNSDVNSKISDFKKIYSKMKAKTPEK